MIHVILRAMRPVGRYSPVAPNDSRGASFTILEQQVAIVTGSTSGIGLGIAEELAAAGADVTVNGRATAAEFNDLIERLDALGGGRVDGRYA